ncbi:peptidase S8/S53 domain-containing protein, partial [Syncephalis pseudoplumigaleata]
MLWIRIDVLEAALLLLVTTGTLLSQASAAEVSSANQVEQYIFSLKRGAEKTAAFEQIRPLIRQRRSLNWPDRLVYTGKLHPKQAEELSKHPAVQSIELDQRISIHDHMPQADAAPDSPAETSAPLERRINLALLQEGLDNWGLERIWQRDVSARNKYEYPISAGANVHVYIIDSGVAVDHPEFEGRATFDVNFVGDEPAQDLDGHGTHVAGIIGGSHHGVAKKARIHAVKVLNSEGVGYVSDVVRGLLYVARATPSDAKGRFSGKVNTPNSGENASNTGSNSTDTTTTTTTTTTARNNSIRVANLSLHTNRSTFLNDA